MARKPYWNMQFVPCLPFSLHTAVPRRATVVGKQVKVTANANDPVLAVHLIPWFETWSLLGGSAMKMETEGHVPPKRLYVPTNPHGITTQSSNIHSIVVSRTVDRFFFSHHIWPILTGGFRILVISSTIVLLSHWSRCTFSYKLIRVYSHVHKRHILRGELSEIEVTKGVRFGLRYCYVCFKNIFYPLSAYSTVVVLLTRERMFSSGCGQTLNGRRLLDLSWKRYER